MQIIFNNVEGNLEVYMDVLRAICGDTSGKSMTDYGCCFAPNTPTLGFEKRRYIDIIDRELDHKSEQRYFFKGDILYKFYQHYVDVSISSDVIEHLTVKDGYRLLKIMEDSSRKQILFTPTTDLFGMAKNKDKDPEKHRSVWKPKMTPHYASIVFPDYHKVWNGGAYFFYRCEDLENDFERVINELKDKTWNVQNGNL